MNYLTRMPIMAGETETYIELKSYIEKNCEYETISRKTNFNIDNCKIANVSLLNEFYNL